MTDWRPVAPAEVEKLIDDQGMIRISSLPECVRSDLVDTLADVAILMNFLIEANDGRLQSQFSDTRTRLAKPTDKFAEPPCETYKEFLEKLSMIRLILADSAGNRGAATLKFEDLGFLQWSRDFLSSVAAPATADSIAITQQYVDARISYSLARLWSRILPGSMERAAAAAADREGRIQSSKSEKRQQVAFWLASMLRRRERGALVLALLVILLSTYSISGQLILRARQAVIDHGKDINQRIESVERNLYTVPKAQTVQVDSSIGTKVSLPFPQYVSLCDLTFRLEPTGGAGGQNGVVLPISNLRGFVSVDQINLCAERQRNLNEGIAVAAQMFSWLRPIDGLRRYGIPQMFGDDRKVAERLGSNLWLCNLVEHNLPSPNTGEKGTQSARACSDFPAILEYYGKVPDAVLQCLALYLLPSLYGALGAIIATIRYIRGRASDGVLTYIDRGRVSQDWILGLVIGAIIGLFADYLAKATPIQGIALSAIALMAGYNVAAVFGLFETISRRLFLTDADANRTSPPLGGTAGSR